MARTDYILDTNVLIHANGDAPPKCKDKCVDVLFQIVTLSNRVVIDGLGEKATSEIIAEYERNIPIGTPGFGTNFLIWLLTNLTNENHVIRVPITPKDDSFEEFPVEKRLKTFDRSDRKWIAAARAHHIWNDIEAIIIQSADMDKWKQYLPIFSELKDHPFKVELLFECDKK